MLKYGLFSRPLTIVVLLCCAAISLAGQTTQPAKPAAAPVAAKEPTHGDFLRGAYGPSRANNDLLYYHLDLRVDPEKKFISGTNTIRFKMLQDGTRIQLELYPTLQIDKVTMGSTTLKYERDEGTFYVDFPAELKAGR